MVAWCDHYCCAWQGTATLNVMGGSVAVVVKAGDIIAHVDNISQDSFIEVETGDVVIHVAPDFPFRWVKLYTALRDVT